MKKRLLLFSAILVIFAGAAHAQIKNLYNFQQSEYPYGSLTQSGNVFYGMTYYGGTANKGYIFSINRDGTGFKDLWNFDDTGHVDSANGAYPLGSLILSGHKLYGMTHGTYNSTYGNVFSINTDGSGYKDLWDFYDTGSYVGNANGAYPCGSLTLVRNKLYGMTNGGGAGAEGNIFSIDTNGGAYKDILDFSQTINGYTPYYGSLVLDGGKLFGTTWGRSCDECRTLNYGYGNVFSIDTDGTHYKDVYVFSGPSGANPANSVVVSQNGKRLYGTTYEGGPSGFGGYGNIFGVDTDGTNFKAIHNFVNTDGAYSNNPLTLVGNTLYGMSTYGGSYLQYNEYGYGTIFSIDTSGSAFTTIFNFNLTSGANPYGGLSVIGDSLYGMTTDGGFNGSGEIFASAIVSPTSIQNIAAVNSQLSVYPNPSNGLFQLKITNYELGATNLVEVYNMLGEKIYTQTNIENSTFNIDLGNQANGVYMYRVLTTNGNMVGEGKVVIQK